MFLYWRWAQWVAPPPWQRNSLSDPNIREQGCKCYFHSFWKELGSSSEPAEFLSCSSGMFDLMYYSVGGQVAPPKESNLLTWELIHWHVTRHTVLEVISPLVEPLLSATNGFSASLTEFRRWPLLHVGLNSLWRSPEIAATSIYSTLLTHQFCAPSKGLLSLDILDFVVSYSSADS